MSLKQKLWRGPRFELTSCFVGPEWVPLLGVNVLFPVPMQNSEVQPADQCPSCTPRCQLTLSCLGDSTSV